MSVETPHSDGSKSKKRGGCLWSCLIASVVLLTLAIVGSAAIYFLGRTYIERQLPAWESRYPAIGLALDLLNLKKGLTPSTSAPGDNELTVGSQRLSGVDDKGQVPEDIPLYSDPLVETYSIGEEQGVGYQRVAASPEEVEQHLREVMPENGWELASEHQTSGGHLFVWSKGDRTCQTEVIPAGGNSEIWLRYQG